MMNPPQTAVPTQNLPSVVDQAMNQAVQNIGNIARRPLSEMISSKSGDSRLLSETQDAPPTRKSAQTSKSNFSIAVYPEQDGLSEETVLTHSTQSSCVSYVLSIVYYHLISSFRAIIPKNFRNIGKTLNFGDVKAFLSASTTLLTPTHDHVVFPGIGHGVDLSMWECRLYFTPDERPPGVKGNYYRTVFTGNLRRVVQHLERM